eukprot:780350-Pyramimonas_sp.AAC.1
MSPTGTGFPGGAMPWLGGIQRSFRSSLAGDFRGGVRGASPASAAGALLGGGPQAAVTRFLKPSRGVSGGAVSAGPQSTKQDGT